MRRLLLFLPLLLFTGAYPGGKYYPLLMTRTELQQSVHLVDSAKPITDPGRICLYGQWILLVENNKGIHLIDNTDPSKPVRKAFLRVPGCRNVAVRDGILYVDNAVDLVGVRVDMDVLRAWETARRVRALPEMVSPEGYIPAEYSRRHRPVSTEIVGWMFQPESNSY